ncbi:MAG: ROK family protein [Thermoanaerobaculales bacterium]|jgi:glucokinase|nr:ROK family protein [Thermoanaerobaculales bacterium]
MNGETVVGVDLGGTKLAAGRVRDGAVEALVRRPVPAAEAWQVVFEVVADAIAEVMTPDVAAIGFGAPSVVDVAQGIVREVGNIPSWREVPLKAALELRFAVPAAVDNDANAFALGEHVFGAGRGFRHLVGMTLGTGLGTGVVIDGRLLHGANCGVGELGKSAHKGRMLQGWCASPYFAREWGAEASELHRRARDGDREALRAFDAYGGELAAAVALALYAYDPEVVVLGGSIATAFDLFEASLRRGLAGFAYPHIVERLTLVPSRLEHAAILGAAALALDRLAE